jgi:hypothetical protein
MGKQVRRYANLRKTDKLENQLPMEKEENIGQRFLA